MPSTVRELFDEAGVRIGGRVDWGQTIREDGPGVYVVAATTDPNDRENKYGASPPIDAGLVRQWINSVSALKLDTRRPSPDELKSRLCSFWLSDETVIYIGKAGTSIKNRVSQYYNTPLGDRKPHAGGHWIKTLTILNELSVFWGACRNPENIEGSMLSMFISSVSNTTRDRLLDPERPFPFANLEFPRGNRKQHGIKNSVKKG